MDSGELETYELASNQLTIEEYKNEKNLILFPFCSTSKRKRIKPINYRSAGGEIWLDVTANNTYGMVKIWDFDILRFVFSRISSIASETGCYPQKVSFTAYECLKSLKRDPNAGKNVQWLRDALDRLTSTTYKGNVFETNAKKVTGFTLIRYEYEEKKNNVERICVTIDERIMRSIKNSENLLCISSRLIRENAGIKKRLLELVDVYMGQDDLWEVPLMYLQQLCANEWPLSKFKYELSTYKDLPWHLTLVKKKTIFYVSFKNKVEECV